MTFKRNTHNSSWVGYAAQPSKPLKARFTADGPDDQMQVRADVFVREFVSVKIAALKASSKESRGARSVSVEFDASSVETGSEKRLSHNFAGSVQEGSEIHKAAVYAHENGIAMYAAIETVRKFKTATSRETISYLTPINVLRGAGTPNAMSQTKENCANVVAVLGPADDTSKNIVSDETRTNPDEWDLFRHNYDGDVPPQGYRHVFTDAGEPAGAIVAADTAPAGGAGDVDALADAVAQKVLATITGDTGTSQQPPRRAVAAEAKPWQQANTDGRVNPASYLVQQFRWARKDALTIIDAAAATNPDLAGTFTPEEFTEAVTGLVRPLLWAAGKVQVKVLGYHREHEASFREAAKWVAQVAAVEKLYQLEFVADRDSSKEWMLSVVELAAQLYSMAVDYAADVSGTPRHYSEGGAEDQAAEAPAESEGGDNANVQSPHEPDETANNGEAFVAASGDSTLIARWDALVEKIGAADRPDALDPILTVTFGTHLTSKIDADSFANVLQAWEADPDRFAATAREAFRTGKAA